jgi:hypothetical protein
VRSNRDAIRAMLVGSAGLLTSACIPIPLMSGYTEDSRQNIPAQVPEFVVTGRTTREDVVLALGEPDRYADDGSWLLYGSVYRTGGLAMVIVAGAPGGGGAMGVAEEKMRYRLLILRFDAAGLVSSSEVTEKRCPEWSGFVGGAGSSDNPCFDLSGDRLVASDRAAAVAPHEHVIETYAYPNVLWWQGREQPPDLPMYSKPEARGEWADLSITDRSLVLTPAQHPAPGPDFSYNVVPVTGTMRLPLSAIREVATGSRNYFVPFVTLTLADGSSCSIQVMKSAGGSAYTWDSKQTRAAGAILQELVHAAPVAAPAIPPAP